MIVTVLSRIVEPSVAVVIPPAPVAPPVVAPVAAPVVAPDEAFPDGDFRFGRASAGIARSENRRSDKGRAQVYINFMIGKNDQR